MIKYIEDIAEKRNVVEAITKTLPEWFGQKKANEYYYKNIDTKDVYGYFENDECCGLIALENTFQASMNIWWLGVHRNKHGQNIGAKLIKKAEEHAKAHSSQYLVLETLHDNNDDSFYNKTIQFYKKNGFESIIETNLKDECPMMWMIKVIN